LIILPLFSDEYDFDMDEFEPKAYEYSGYLRLDNKFQQLNENTKNHQNYMHLEALFDFSYFYDIFTFKSSLMGTYDYIKDKNAKDNYPINELYIEAELNKNHTILVGKESLGWGKGYFFNPVAFFDRPKDPTQPTKTREGFIISKYSYNKSFQTILKNLSFDIVYLPSSDTINKDYYTQITKNQTANNIALRLYLLLYDTDIDIIYKYSDVTQNQIGIDFSKNLQTNFEIHGEFSTKTDDDYLYLLGFRYLTNFELTIISEYLYNSDGLNKKEIELSNSLLPFLAKDYWITLITQKEPFEWLYSSIYYKNMINIQDNSMQNKLGVNYSFKNNIDIDLSYNINSGSKLSEFGKKSVSDFAWLQLTWNY
ncbi:MAG: hypothetical protein K8R44_07555, partial [Sulfurimonas sp.]|nr:hypothetical protein [Sulfurimonas sp.]